MNIAVTGATGRMGRAVITAAVERPDATVALAFNRTPSENKVAGVRIRPVKELQPLLDRYHPNVLIDFSAPESAVKYGSIAADAGIPFVTGTTGFSETQRGDLQELSSVVPILASSNFAAGIQAVLAAVQQATAMLPDYDIEILETHHNQKRDAPSGTAHTILDQIESVRGESHVQHGRKGDQPRKSGEIGVHARRAGTIRGEHEILLADNDEIVSISHRAESRRVYAEGAIDAAIWVTGQPPGWYDYTDTFEI